VRERTDPAPAEADNRGIDPASIAAFAATVVSIKTERNGMSIGTIVLIILVLALVGVIPAWPHSSGWGYGPSGGIGLIVVVLLVLLLMGRI
jgi:hypothetical protein